MSPEPANKQTVLVEFKNCAPFVYEFISKDPITIERVAKYFEETEGFNEEQDSITFLDKDPTRIII
jgi:hypothetical protein